MAGKDQGGGVSASVTFTIAGKEEAEQLKARLRQEATAQGKSLSEWITEALVDYLRKTQVAK